MSSKIVIIDGLSVFMRHYCANPTMSQNGDHMGGFAGFLGSLRDVSRRFTPKQIVVVWEGGGSKKRRLIDKAYKRGKKPVKRNRYYGDELPDTHNNRNDQVSKLVTALKHLPIKQIYVPDCEGDDAVAHLSRLIVRDGSEDVVIVSSDRDFYQLITDRVTIWSPGRRKQINSKECIEEFRVHPNNIFLAKAIVGDSSDNVKGVSGVGYKTLTKRIPGFDQEDIMDLQDVVHVCETSQKTSKAKIYVDIPNELSTIRTNIRLVSLDAGTLPGHIANKIETSYNSSATDGTPNKIELYRFIMHEGLPLLDIDSIFSSLHSARI